MASRATPIPPPIPPPIPTEPLLKLTNNDTQKSTVNYRNYYTITLPRQIQANSVYVVSATYHGFSESKSSPLNVNVKIQPTLRSDVEVASGSVSIPPGSTKQLPIKVESFTPGRYLITTTLSGPMNDVKTQYVNLESKTFSTFIQTDKALYQPSQLVQFRVVVVDPNLIPYQKETLTVRIKDSQDNIIKQWKDAPRAHGVFHSELLLSDQPVMGDWKIIAQIGDANLTEENVTEAVFTVKEYVLPKFEVTVITPYVTFNNNNNTTFTITVTAKYTFGGPVNGNLDLTLEPINSSRLLYHGSKPKSVQVKVPINGIAQVEVKASDLGFDIPSLQTRLEIFATKVKGAFNPGQRRPYIIQDELIDVVAVVTEELTGIQQNQTARMTIYAKDEKLTLTRADNFKPGLPFKVTVELTRQDGQPIANTDNEPVNLSINFGASGPTATPQSSVFRDGVAVFTIVPLMGQTSMTITATYKKTVQNTVTIYAVKAIPNSTKFITINLKTKTPTVGENIDIEVQTTFGMTAPLSYVVVGRGNIRTSGSLPTSGQTMVTFSFLVTSFMAPHARMVVYYTDLVGGEMIADSVNISIGGTFRNSVSLQTSADNLEPGNNVTLTLNAKPDSLVAIRGMDMSVLLLQNGNDITHGKVFDELKNYDNFNSRRVGSVGYLERVLKTHGGTFERIFEYAGLNLITNGNHYIDPIERHSLVYNFSANPQKLAPDRVPETTVKPTTVEPRTVKPTRVRTLFPETFIWTTTNTTKDGSVILKYTVPDTITTWIVDAYATNDLYGIGIMEQPKNITVYRKFFIVMNLPYSVVNKEIITVQILVFNYDKNSQEVKVTLSNDENEYIFINKQEENVKILNNQAVSLKMAKADAATAFAFTIQPTTIGQISLNVKATSATAGDAMVKQLLVKAEGSTEYHNTSVMIDLRKSPTFSSQVQISVPDNAIKGSEYIDFTAIGDFMAPILKNIKQLIRMPTGCGEQNMIHFVPDVVIMKYLQTINSLTSDIKNTLMSYLLQGYQRELIYKHNDGSYSAFGGIDSSGSTWLTAYVLKSFNLAKPYITIDDKVISAAMHFLFRQQEETGEFSERVNVKYVSQGGSATGVGLTAFVIIAILEANNQTPHSEINEAVTYLEDQLDVIDNVYNLSIVTYALQLAPSSQHKDKAFALLQEKITRSGDFAYWQSSVTKPSEKYSFCKSPTSYDIEATSYALLSYATRGLAGESLSILRWLISKQNSLGGFSSSQDTVIGIQALATVGGSFTGAPDSIVKIAITYEGKSHTFELNNDNAMVTQKMSLPKTVRTVEIIANGSGSAIAQLSWNYNIVIADPKQFFQVTPTVTSTGRKTYTLKVRAMYLGENIGSMVLFNVNTLSGYRWDRDSLPNVGNPTGLKQRDLSNGDTLITFYFDKITPDGTCISMNATSTEDILNLQDAEIAVCDYYNTINKGEAYYNLPQTT